MVFPPLNGSLEWRGRSVAWECFGSGPPLVFLHGTHGHRLFGAPLLRFFPENSLFISGICLDMGLRARILHEARYRSLCLVDVVALSPWGSPFFTLVKQHADIFTQIPGPIHQGMVEAYIRGASDRGLPDQELAMLVAPWLGNSGQEAFYRQIAQAEERFTDEIEPSYGSLDEPVHIIWGTADTWIPVERARRLRAAIPHASLSLIENAGHLIQLDAAAELIKELRRWLTEGAS